MAVSRLSQQSLQQAFPKGNTFWDGTTATSAFDSLGSILVPSGGVTTITFSSIPATYTHLQLRMSLLNSTGNQVISMKVNGGVAANTSFHALRGNGTAASAESSANTNSFPVFGRVVGTSTTAPSVVIIDLLDYSSTSKAKTIRSLGGCDQNGTGEVNLISAAYYPTATAISSLELGPYNGAITFTQHSSFALYGIK
jgi:hypothetical protein